MIRLTFSALVWLLAYLLIVLAPLIGGVLNLSHGRGFFLNLSIALGFVALSIFGAQFITVLRARMITAPLGILANLVMHRLMGYFATVLALLHVILLLVLDRKYWALLDVTTSPPRAKFAVGATLALLFLVALSCCRERIGMPYRVWHWLHWLLALVVFGGALTHAELVNYYLQDKVEQLIWMSLGLLFVMAAFWARFVNPYLRWRHRWQVKSVHSMLPGVTELLLEPVNRDAWGARGFSFKAGQFVWLIAGRSPFSISANPFTIASSALSPWRIRFIVRANSGYTAALQTLQPGTTVYLDGPHGTFTPDPENDGPLVLIGAGVGITPLLSMAESLADAGSRRKVVILLSNRYAGQVIGSEHLDALQGRLNLDLYCFFSENGTRLDARYIQARLPADAATGECFICGGAAFMDMAQAALRDAGIPRAKIHAERFSMT